MMNERIMLGSRDPQDDLYSGFNDSVHPALDTRVSTFH